MTDHLPTLPVTRGIEYTTDGQLLIDGAPVAPGQWRLQMPDGAEMILTVADPPPGALCNNCGEVPPLSGGLCAACEFWADKELAQESRDDPEEP